MRCAPARGARTAPGSTQAARYVSRPRWSRVVAGVALAALAAGVALAQGQAPAGTDTVPPGSLRFGEYLAQVGHANLGLLAQRAGMPVADAQVVLARIFPDPVVTAGVPSWDVSQVGAQNNVAVGVTVPVEWPQKRPARVALARANRDVALADLADFARTLRGTAATAYVDALLADRVLLRRRQAFESLERIVTANEERHRQGAVAEVVVLSARIEARRYHGDVVAAEGEAAAARVALLAQMGLRDLRPEQLPAAVDGELRVAPRHFTAEVLIEHALRVRPDVVARREAVRAAGARLNLAYANRGVDMALNLGWMYYTTGAPGSAFQAPPYHTINAMVSVPLPLSQILNGEVNAGRATQAQAEAQRTALELQVAAEIRAALLRYEAAQRRLSEYDRTLLLDSDRLLQMARYAFEQGAMRIIELLSAQRTWTETHIAYETAQADHTRALIALQTAADQWDLTL